MDESEIPTKEKIRGDVELNSNSSSLNLSITPPLFDVNDNKQQKHEVKDGDESISEHLSSIENDRSLPELQVSTQFGDLLTQNAPSDRDNISQEAKPASFNNTSSNLSPKVDDDDSDVNFRTNTADNNVKSILEEMLSNEELQPEIDSSDKNRDKTDGDDDEETFNIFTNLNLDDKLVDKDDDKDKISDDYNEIQKRVKDFEELLAIKDSTIAALTTELDSYRELMSNQSSLGTSTTEYKQLQEEAQNRLTEFHNTIVHKDELIRKLTESLQQSTLNCEDLKKSSTILNDEILELKQQLESTTKLLENQQQYKNQIDNNNLITKLENLQISQEIQQDIIEIFYQELEKLKNNNDLKRLELKHAEEMEELRTYFEQKCADLEKNYSEEVFSQQSRKLSSSSTNTVDNQDELTDEHQQQEEQDNLPPLGPGGDNFSRYEYTRKDLQKLYIDLQKILQLFTNFNNNKSDNSDKNLENLNDNDFNRLKTEISRYDLKNLFKYDLGQIQNQYHAELEIMQEDYDNRLDLLNLENEKKLKEIEGKYCREIDELKQQLDGINRSVAITPTTTTTQEVISGDFEIDEVVQSYEQRLQEQIALAKIDLINSLENQIQRLVNSDRFEEDWPDELLRLKDRFAEKYRKEIAEIETKYVAEIDSLKNRLRQRNNNNNNDNLIRDCEFYKNQTTILRYLIEELLKYFTQCENELNNTIINDFLNKNTNEISIDDNNDNIIKKQIRFTPSTNELLNLIDNTINDDNLTQSSIDLQGELGNCLEKLKIDANEILLLTNNLNQTKITTNIDNRVLSLTQQLNESKTIIKTIENERTNLENQLDDLLNKQQLIEHDLMKARNKISELIDNGRKEIVSEGYGENGKPTSSFVDTVAALGELQEKSRSILEHPDGIDSNICEIIENYLRITEKLIDEAKKDRQDYQQQIDAADKKYKSTCQFLEEQANEREQERDDAQKLINNLREELKIRDKDRINHERVNQEVENLEQQIRDMSHLIDDNEKRYQNIDVERQEAIEKIHILRDIIRDLENQIETKQASENQLKNLVEELEILIKQPKQPQQRDNSKIKQTNPETLEQIEQLHQQINELENELQHLRLNSEIAGNEGPIKQIQIHLNEFETTLDQCTKDLEIHSTIATCCSSPSEDMSVRDVVNSNISNTVLDECEIPLQQLARLKEKLMRHSRAEDAAFKRIQDLEMQIANLKSELDDNQNERDLLKKQITDQLVSISSLQIRLDEQRIRAEHIEKQTNTSLEVRIYDLQDKLMDNEEKLIKKDKLIQQLNQQIDELKTNFDKFQIDNDNNKKINDNLIVEMQKEIEHYRNNNQQLQSKNNNLNQILKEQQQQLDIYKNLDLDQTHLDYLNKLKSTGLSLIDLIEKQSDQIEPIRRFDSNNSAQLSRISPLKQSQKHSETVLEISCISPLQPINIKANSTEKHVHFGNISDKIDNNGKIGELERELLKRDQIISDYRLELEKLEDLEGELLKRDQMISDYRLRLEKLEDLERKVGKLQENLDNTEIILKQTTQQFDKELKDKSIIENDLKLYKSKNDQLTGDLLKYQANLKQLDEKLQQSINNNEELNSQINQQQNDLIKQQNLLFEKDKIIEQITEDSRSLHINLETIQNKLQETGNIVDLLQRLRDEQKKNVDLTEEIHNLKLQLYANDPLITPTTNDIVGQVQKELNYSNYLDNVIIENVIEPIQDIDLLQKKFDEEIIKCRNFEKQLETIKIDDRRIIDELHKQYDCIVQDKLQLENLIGIERQKRNDIERELFVLKQQFDEDVRVKTPDSTTDYRELYDFKLKKLKKQCDLLNDNNKKLNDDLMLLKNEKLQIEATLKSTQVLFNIKENECTQLNQQMDYLITNEKRLLDELENVRAKFEEKTKEIDEIHQDRLQMKRQMDVLNQKLKNTDNNREEVPAKLMEKIKEINASVKDNIYLVDLVTRLNNEKLELEQRIVDLEQQNSYNLPFDDPTSRANYLFAKYLRADSYRKALIWQKRYLFLVAGTHDITKLITTDIKFNRFRIVALAIIVVNRMKYLVKRWHSGKRIIQQRSKPTEFHVGQPVSSQNFAFIGSSRSADEWSGQTPPTKDRKLPKSEPLKSPNLLAKYVERFNQIQEKLKLKEVVTVDLTTPDSS